MANNEEHIEAKPEGVAVFIKGKSSENARLVISEAELEAQKPSSAVDDAAQLKVERDHDRGAPSPDAPCEIAVFDFDGTCISGNSPVLLVRYLLKKGQVRTSVLLRILTWGIAYKLASSAKRGMGAQFGVLVVRWHARRRSRCGDVQVLR